MIAFDTSLVGHCTAGLALAGIVALRAVRAGVRVEVRDRVAIGSISLPAMVKQGYPMRFGAR